jgi:predicted nucleotide-binding protein
MLAHMRVDPCPRNLRKRQNAILLFFYLNPRKKIKRARQNVVLEIGYFWGSIGRRESVAFLVEDDPIMELPNDIQGLGWIPITNDLGETKLKLRHELEHAGVI